VIKLVITDPPAREQLPQQVGGGSLEAFGLLDRGLDRGRQVLADHRLEQVFLAREVQVQRSLRDSGARGDLVRSRRREALLGEQFERRVDELLRARLLAALAWRSGAGVHRRDND
jgi:hypothetical protein